MATKVIMPQGGQDLTEGTVVQWLKQEGETVQKDEVICEVETEKAVFEVTAPCDGVLIKITAQVGEVAEVFSAIGYIGEPGEQVPVDAPAQKPAAPPTETSGKPDIAAIRKRLGKDRPSKSKRIKASGRAKKLAKEQGVDLAAVQGTGPGGRITENDIQTYLEQAAAPAASTVVTPSEPAPPPPASPPTTAAVPGKTVPMSKIRAVIARRLQQSKQTIPHFYVTVTAEMTAALKLRQELNAQLPAESPAKISINDMVVKAAALALEEFYQVNCQLQDNNLVYLDTINIGIAVSLEDRLVVPVLTDAEVLSLKGIAKKSKDLVALAKAGKQADMARASFTISNMGMMDVENFAAIINPPESAILAVSSVQKGVTVSEHNDLSIRDLMKMTISADHRIVDGVLAARFINKIKYHLQHPQTLLT
jgi:pyruvate dehydrogenase E2 component (dihydrolipoamide acetyltransferase)